MTRVFFNVGDNCLNILRPRIVVLRFLVFSRRTQARTPLITTSAVTSEQQQQHYAAPPLRYIYRNNIYLLPTTNMKHPINNRENTN